MQNWDANIKVLWIKSETTRGEPVQKRTGAYQDGVLRTLEPDKKLICVLSHIPALQTSQRHHFVKSLLFRVMVSLQRDASCPVKIHSLPRRFRSSKITHFSLSAICTRCTFEVFNTEMKTLTGKFLPTRLQRLT